MHSTDSVIDLINAEAQIIVLPGDTAKFVHCTLYNLKKVTKYKIEEIHNGAKPKVFGIFHV